MNKDLQKVVPSIFGAIFVPFFEFMYGDGDIVRYIMIALTFFVVMDWISGTRASKRDETYASEYGIDGIFRTLFILLLPAGGNFIDQITGTNGIVFGALAMGVLYHVIQSMTANAIRAGWGRWFPEWLLNKLADWVKEEIESKISRSESRKKLKIEEEEMQ